MKGEELAAEIPAARHSSIPIPQHTELLVEATQVEYCLEAMKLLVLKKKLPLLLFCCWLSNNSQCLVSHFNGQLTVANWTYYGQSYGTKYFGTNGAESIALTKTPKDTIFLWKIRIKNHVTKLPNRVGREKSQMLLLYCNPRRFKE